MNKHFLNLTNGIEWLDDLPMDDINFIRIQSTTIERNNWIKLFTDLDHNFLLHLAIGSNCKVYDCGTNRECSKSIYKGLEVIRYVLNRYWFDIKPDKVFRLGRDGRITSQCIVNELNNIYENLFIYNITKEKEAVKTKLKYYKKFLMCNEITLEGYSKSTIHDGNWTYYHELLKSKISE